MLILKTVALEPLHGYGVGLRIEQISKGIFQMNAGSLFPALRRLERQGLIKGEWRATENNRHAKYYMLTEDGPEETQDTSARMANAECGDCQDSGSNFGRIVMGLIKVIGGGLRALFRKQQAGA